MDIERLIWIAQRMLHVSEVGLQYSSTPYETDRYQEVRALGLELLSSFSGHSVSVLEEHVPLSARYQTAKVDVRAVVFNEKDEILLVQERADGGWTLPGGWADPGFSPKQVAEKECFEEAGVRVSAKELWAVLDKAGWGHPIPLHPTYKIFIFCERSEGEPTAGYEVLDAGYFRENEWGVLSLERTTPAQLEVLFKMRRGKLAKPIFN